MHIGKNISYLRELRHIKQSDMAGRLGMSQQSYSNIEQLPIVADLMLRKIAKELCVSTKILKTYDNEKIINCLLQNTNLTIQIVLKCEVKNFDHAHMSVISDMVKQLQKMCSITVESCTED